MCATCQSAPGLGFLSSSCRRPRRFLLVGTKNLRVAHAPHRWWLLLRIGTDNLPTRATPARSHSCNGHTHRIVGQLPQEARFHSTHGHTRVLIVGIHWPSWVNDGKPYAAGKLLRDLTLVQQVLATLHWPDSPPEVLAAIDRMFNAVAYTPTVKADLIDLSDGIDAPMDLNGLPEEDLLRMGESIFGAMLSKQQQGEKLEVKPPSAVPHRKMTFTDEKTAAATAAAIDS